MKTVNIVSNIKRYGLYMNMLYFFDCEKICIYHKPPKIIQNKGIVIIDFEYLFFKKKNKYINFLKKNIHSNEIIIFFWNGYYDYKKFYSEILEFKNKFEKIDFFFVCGGLDLKIKQSNLIKEIMLTSPKNYTYSSTLNLHIRILLSKIKNFFVKIIYYQKIEKFKKYPYFVFVGKWKFNLEEIFNFTDQFDIDRSLISNLLKKIKYFDATLQNLDSEDLSNLIPTNSLPVNYFLYNIYARKKIIETLKSKNRVLLIDDYSKPDFLNQSFKTQSTFLDLGCKSGISKFYPRHLALKLNYKDNYRTINFFNDKIPNEANFINSIKYINNNCKNFKLNNIFFSNNK